MHAAKCTYSYGRHNFYTINDVPVYTVLYIVFWKILEGMTTQKFWKAFSAAFLMEAL